MIKVTGCRILVRPLDLAELDPVMARAKALGIEFEKDERKAKAHAEKGVVLELGPRVNEDYTEGANVGDTIGFTKFGGKFVKEGPDSEELLIINDEDVICVFKETVNE